MTNDLHFCQQIAGNPRQSFEEQLAKPCRQRRSRRLLLMLPPQAQQCRLRWHRLLSPPLLQAHQVQLNSLPANGERAEEPVPAPARLLQRKRPPPRPMPRPMPPHPLLCPPPHPLPPHPLPRPMQLSSQPGRPAGEAEAEVQAEEAWVPARAPLPRQKRPPPRPMQQEVIHVLPDVLSCRAGSWIRYLQSQHRPAVLSQACRRHPAHA